MQQREGEKKGVTANETLPMFPPCKLVYYKRPNGVKHFQSPHDVTCLCIEMAEMQSLVVWRRTDPIRSLLKPGMEWDGMGRISRDMGQSARDLGLTSHHWD